MNTYQCSHRYCRKRWRFTKPLERMVHRPPRLTREWKCGACGKGELRPTAAFIRTWNARHDTCHCGLIPYPHRKGSCHAGRACAEHASMREEGPLIEAVASFKDDGTGEVPF